MPSEEEVKARLKSALNDLPPEKQAEIVTDLIRQYGSPETRLKWAEMTERKQ